VGDAARFTAVQPDEKAVAAGIDDDVAGACVEVGFHAAMALGTLQSALEIVLIGRDLHGGDLFADSTKGINKGHQLVHGHQQAVALRATENGNFGDSGMAKRQAADRAGERERRVDLSEKKLHSVFFLPRKEDGVAVVALETFGIRFECDRSPAGGATHCG
jgi:hypothetical protein